MSDINNTVQCYLEETRSFLSELRKAPDNYYKLLKTLSMTKDNSNILGYIPVYKLYKALESLYKALCDDKLTLSDNVKILINIVADKISECCNKIESAPEELKNIDIKPFLLYCDKAVAGEIFDPKHLIKHAESKSRLEKKINNLSKKKTIQKKNEVLLINSEKIAKIITLHEEMIARTYIISNQISMLKNALADKNMLVLKDTYKLLSNDSLTLQNSILLSHESLLNLIEDDAFLQNHQDMYGFFVTANDKKYLIPSEYIFDVICETSLNYETVQNQKILKYVIENENGIKEEADTEQIPVYSLSSLFPDQKAREANAMDTILIVNYQSQKIGIIVDSVQKFVSVIKKNMPSAFENFSAVQGVAFDEKYDMIPILHVPEIMRKFRSLRGYDIKKFEAITKKHINKVLIVDDSETTRQIEKTILTSNKFLVDEAVDGIDAMDKIKQKQFDIIICDDEMPRMNGDILLDNIRRMENYRMIPVVAVADKPLEKANAFVNKAEFSRNNLIKTLKRMLGDE